MRLVSAVLAVSLIAIVRDPSPAQTSRLWKMHDMSRPHPPIVTVPGQQLPVPPPSDAMVLFNGKDLSHWRSQDSGAAQWTVRDGYFESIAGSGSIHTLEHFGDVQLHVEWAAPVPVSGTGQGRGNSGIFLMGLYEIQILDSYHNDTYADGQASAVYGQFPPLFNASRPPGEWQSYDIVFRRPRFDSSGALLRPARVTLLHNGILVQDNVEPTGPTSWLQNAPYRAHADRLPFSLQDHSSPVRFRNIWARDLGQHEQQGVSTPSVSNSLSLPLGVADRYAGTYVTKSGFRMTIVREGEHVLMNVGSDHVVLEARSPRDFALSGVDARLEFVLDENGVPDNCIFQIGGEEILFSRRRE